MHNLVRNMTLKSEDDDGDGGDRPRANDEKKFKAHISFNYSIVMSSADDRKLTVIYHRIDV